MYKYGRKAYLTLTRNSSTQLNLVKNGSSSLISQNLLQNINKNLCFNVAPRRFMYTDNALGMDRFLASKQFFQKKYHGKESEEFFTRIEESLNDSRFVHRHNKFKQDLEIALFITTNEEQLQIIHRMAKTLCRLNSDKTSVKVGEYDFGVLLMSLYYNMNLPDRALEYTTDEELQILMRHPAAQTVLLSLLYRNERYSDMLAVMKVIRSGRYTDQRFPKRCVLLTLAGALQSGTEEHLKLGLELAETALESGLKMRRVEYLSALIALKAGQPATALKLLKAAWLNAGYSVFNIQVCAMCDLGDLDPVLSQIAQRFQNPNASRDNSKNFIYRHTYNKIVAAIHDTKDKALLEKWTTLERELVDRECVVDTTMEEFFFKPIEEDNILANNNESKLSPQRKKSTFNSNNSSQRRRSGYSGIKDTEH